MEIVIRATVIFWVIWLITRGLGKRELSELSPFELILLVVIGDFVQQGVTQEDFSIVGSVAAVGTVAAWVLLLGALTNRSARAQRVLESRPAVIVRDGQLLRDVMRLERVTEDDVKESARQKGIASLDDVAYGILEPDGQLSFIRDDAVTPDDGGEGHQATR